MNKSAEEYPEGSVSLANSAAESEADVCAICYGSDGLDIKTHCCGHLFHYDCLCKWVHGSEDMEAHNNCPLCRREMDLTGEEYNKRGDKNSPFYRSRPERFVWNGLEQEWNYTGPFPDFVTCLSTPENGEENIFPEKLRGVLTDPQYVISWNRRGVQPNGDTRKFTTHPCQCGRQCGRGVYVLGKFEEQVLLNKCNFVCYKGLYMHEKCHQRDTELYEEAKTYTNNFQLNTCFLDNLLKDNKTRLSTLLQIRKPDGVRRLRKECSHCNNSSVFLFDDGLDVWQINELLDENGWKRIRFKGGMVCKNCVEHYNHCNLCESHYPKEFAFCPQGGAGLCYPCGEATMTVNSFVKERGAWVDGMKMYLPQAVCYYGNSKREEFFEKLNRCSGRQWKFYLFNQFKKEFVVLCKAEKSESRFIRAIVTLQRTYRKKAWKFVRTFSQNFTRGLYPAAMALMSAESLQLWTPPGLFWRMLSCTCDGCVGWDKDLDDGFHTRTVMVLSESKERFCTESAVETDKKHGWRYFEAGEEVCPDCYAKKRELACTFTHGFQEDYIQDESALPEGLEWDELREIVEEEGLYVQFADCDGCRTRQYCVCEEDCQQFFWDGEWYATSHDNHFCPDCYENYVSCQWCHDDEVPADETKCLRNNEAELEVCEQCYFTIRFGAAVTIQRHVRGFLIRQKALRHKDAVTIQRICRGHIARKRMKKLKEAIVEYVRKESGGTMVLKEGVHDFPFCSHGWYFLLNEPEFDPGFGFCKRFMEVCLQPYFPPETYIECGDLFCEHCHLLKCYITYQYRGYTGYNNGWEVSTFYASRYPIEISWNRNDRGLQLSVKPSCYRYSTKFSRLICPECIKAHFTACRGCSKSYYPKDLIDGRCSLCLEAEAADASKRIQRAFRSYAKRKVYIAVRDAYVACCTFTDKFKPGLYRDEHCLSSFLKLMPSVYYYRKNTYVACDCVDYYRLTDWVYIFDKTGPNYVPINRMGEWQCPKCLPTTTGSKKRAATEQSEGQTSKRVKKVSASMRDLVTKWLEEGGEDPRGTPPSNDYFYNYQTESWEYSSHLRDKRLRTRRRRGLNLKKGD